jgi:hypothetical protein
VSENYAITLVPNDWELRAKAHTLGEREWAKAVKLVDRTGFRPNIIGGLDKRDVGPFARNLAQAVEQERLTDRDRRVFDDLIDFLTNRSGGRGLAITRGWRKWNQT